MWNRRLRNLRRTSTQLDTAFVARRLHPVGVKPPLRLWGIGGTQDTKWATDQPLLGVLALYLCFRQWH